MSAISIRRFRAGDEGAFRRLNEAWIRRSFRIEPKDEQTLGDPQGAILDGGGQILMLLRGEVPIGCCALLWVDAETLELGKMTIDEAHRGGGYGRRLLAAAIDEARGMGARRIYLETNSGLAPALRLYEAHGFRRLPQEGAAPSAYARADVRMERWL